jgi:protein TonB
MSDLLAIDGMISAGGEEVVRVEASARTAPGWSLPLAGALLLHLLFLALALAVPRLGGEREAAPVVYPIRLYTVAEVPLEATPEARPARLASLVRPAGAVKNGGEVRPMPHPAEIPTPVAVVPAATVPEAMVAEAVSLSAAVVADAPTSPAMPLAGVSARAIVAVAAGGGGLDEAVLPVGAGKVAPTAAEPVLVQAQPLYRENPVPEYPPLARRRNLQGTVLLEVLVDGRGQVGALAVHRSSGQPLLDEAALKCVKGWRFEPGRRGGEPMAMQVLVPVRFALR